MNQSKIFSFIESVINVILGMIFALIIQILILNHQFNLNLTLIQNIQINFIFTMVSMIRSYIIRRVFNKFS